MSTKGTGDNKKKIAQSDKSNDIPGLDLFEHAACKGKTNLMFPKEHKDITYIAEARAICKTCPVQKLCLEYALDFPAADMHGVWAGLTSRQLEIGRAHV